MTSLLKKLNKFRLLHQAGMGTGLVNKTDLMKHTVGDGLF